LGDPVAGRFGEGAGAVGHGGSISVGWVQVNNGGLGPQAPAAGGALLWRRARAPSPRSPAASRPLPRGEREVVSRSA
jgi:hypothetical protein